MALSLSRLHMLKKIAPSCRCKAADLSKTVFKITSRDFWSFMCCSKKITRIVCCSIVPYMFGGMHLHLGEKNLQSGTYTVATRKSRNTGVQHKKRHKPNRNVYS